MIKITISPAQRRKLDAEMKEFAKRAGVAVGDTVVILAQSCAKELARKVQPWGLNQGTGDRFMQSIAKQVHKAAKYAVGNGIDGEIQDVHAKLRNKDGQVGVTPPKEITPKREWFISGKVKYYIKQQQAKAGKAKAGWIAAGENISSPLLLTSKNKKRKIKGISKWIRRHVKEPNGTAKFNRQQGLSSSVALTNKVDYAYSVNNTNKGYVASSLADGYKRSVTVLRKRIKELS
jgi:hypothetical protein